MDVVGSDDGNRGELSSSGSNECQEKAEGG